MFCPKCGTENDNNAYRCVSCQTIIQIQPIPLASQPVNANHTGYDSDLKYILPVGRSALAVAAGYLGLLSIVPGIGQLAILLGVLALRDIKKNPKKLGKGRAIFGVILGSLCSILHVFLLISSLAANLTNPM
jgi:hypothetical protein